MKLRRRVLPVVESVGQVGAVGCRRGGGVGDCHREFCDGVG